MSNNGFGVHHVQIPQRHVGEYYEALESQKLNNAFNDVKATKEYRKLPIDLKMLVEHEFYQSSKDSEFLERIQGILEKGVG